MTLRCKECLTCSRQPQDAIYKKTGYCKTCRNKLIMSWLFPTWVFVKKTDLEFKAIYDR